LVDVAGVLGWDPCVHRYRFLQIQINDYISQVSLKHICLSAASLKYILAFEGGGHLYIRKLIGSKKGRREIMQNGREGGEKHITAKNTEQILRQI
jgi:hypothetical protein